MNRNDNRFHSWPDLVEAIRTLPLTWLPAALLILVEECVTRNCFKPEGLQKAIQEKLNYMKDPSRKREQL